MENEQQTTFTRTILWKFPNSRQLLPISVLTWCFLFLWISTTKSLPFYYNHSMDGEWRADDICVIFFCWRYRLAVNSWKVSTSAGCWYSADFLHNFSHFIILTVISRWQNVLKPEPIENKQTIHQTAFPYSHTNGITQMVEISNSLSEYYTVFIYYWVYICQCAR